MIARKPLDMISMIVTTRCSRGCPRCAFKYPEVWDASAKYVRNALAIVGPIRRLHMGGGEPCEHLDYQAIVDEFMAFKSAGGCHIITLEASRFHEASAVFDQVYFTDYGTNKQDLGSFRRESRGEVFSGTPIHYPDIPGDGTICHRGLSENVVVYKGFVYPCCASVNVRGVRSIPLTKQWRSEIALVDPPCAACRFSGKG